MSRFILGRQLVLPLVHFPSTTPPKKVRSQDFTLQCGSKCLSTAYTTPAFTLEGKNPAHHIWVLLLLV